MFFFHPAYILKMKLLVRLAFKEALLITLEGFRKGIILWVIVVLCGNITFLAALPIGLCRTPFRMDSMTLLPPFSTFTVQGQCQLFFRNTVLEETSIRICVCFVNAEESSVSFSMCFKNLEVNTMCVHLWAKTYVLLVVSWYESFWKWIERRNESVDC